MKIGYQLKKARESKRLSQHVVYEILRLSHKTLSNVESNKSQPSVTQLALMGEIYKLDILALLSSKEIFLAPTSSNKKKNFEAALELWE